MENVITVQPLIRACLMKYFYWRGRSLWCTYKLPGKPNQWPLDIKRLSDSKTEVQRCLRLGEERLAALRATFALEDTIYATEKVIEYNPSYCALSIIYYHNHLKLQKSGRREWNHLKFSQIHFGKLLAKEITREHIEAWRQGQKEKGLSINLINNRWSYMKAVFNWANSENNSQYRLTTNPFIGMKKLKGAVIRQFVLTKEMFERNYLFLKNGKRWPGEKPNKHCSSFKHPPAPQFALFYLALWSTYRRPEEVSQYTWEMVRIIEMDGKEIHAFMVPPEICKTDKPSTVIISDRLWFEMNQTAIRTGLIFRNEQGDRWQNWKRHREKLKEEFGESAGWIRDTRRGGITHMVEIRNIDPLHVRMQSGHKSNAVFERYRIGKLEGQLSAVDNEKLDYNFITVNLKNGEI